MDFGNGLVELSKMLGGSLQEPGTDLYLDNDVEHVPAAALTPAQIGPPAKKAPSQQQQQANNKKVVSKDIWDAEEVPVSGFGAESDPRKRPEYEILYKQAVSAEDMFIGLSGRDPSSGSCEDLLVWHGCYPLAL